MARHCKPPGMLWEKIGVVNLFYIYFGGKKPDNLSLQMLNCSVSSPQNIWCASRTFPLESMKGPHAHSYQELHTLTKLFLGQSVMTVSMTVKPYFSTGIAEWLKCGPEVTKYTLQLKKSLSLIKAFEGLRKLDKVQGYYTFQEVKEYFCRWLGISLGFISFWWQWTCGSVHSFTLSETLCSKQQPLACPVLICF